MIRMLSAGDKLAEIKRLYYRTSRATIKEDFAKAVDLLKSMSSEEERERVAVYMDGLSQMRSDWARMSQSARKSEKGRTKKNRRRGP
jgi:phosphodiesterase/alkaline phosphatase D-like protein